MKEPKTSSNAPEKRVYAINLKGEASPENASPQQSAHQDYRQGAQLGDAQASTGQPEGRNAASKSQDAQKTGRPDHQQR